MDQSPTRDEWAATSRSLRQLARSLTVQVADAEDLAQSTMVTALTHPPRFLSRGWLERVLRNRAADHHRNEGTRRNRQAELAPAAPEPATSDIIEQLEVYRLLTESVQALAAEQREAVFMRYFDGLTPTEVAEQLGVPVKTVKTRLNRALSVLRRQLEKKRGSDWRAALLPLCALRPDALLPIAVNHLTSSPLSTLLTTGALMSKRTAIFAVLGLGFCSLLVMFAVDAWPFDQEAEARRKTTPIRSESVAIDTEAPASKTAKADVDRQVVMDSAMAEGVKTPESNDIPRGTIQVRILWHDSTPAANVTTKISPLYGGGSPFDQQRQVSDENGIVSFTDIKAGKYRVRSGRGGDADAEAVEGETSEIELKLERNIEVKGTVVDAEGLAIGGATIWLTSRSTGWSGMTAVGETDIGGRFSLRSIPPKQSLGATASQYSPSALVDLEDLNTSYDLVEVSLTLKSKGGDLTGIVTTASGEPLAKALVCLGKPTHHGYRVGSSEKEVWTPITVKTDAKGRYRVHGLSPGPQSISVLGAHHPIWRGEIEILARKIAVQDVHLLAGVTVRGLVTNVDGEPAVGARIAAYDIAPRLSFIQMGQIDYDEAFGYARAIADASGHYRISYVVPGTVRLFAIEAGRGLKEKLHTKAEFECDPNGELVWDAVLSPGNTIGGLVLYRDGLPMVNHFVSIRNSKTGKRHSVTTTKDGKFRFTNLQAASYTVRVQYWDAPKGSKPLLRENVWPDGKEQRLMAPFDSPRKQKPGKVRGKIVDAAGRLKHATALRMILHRGRSWYNGPKFDGMNFVFDSIVPGRVRAIVFSGEEVIGKSNWVVLEDGQDLDIGTITTEPGGTLRVEVSRTTGSESLTPTLTAKPVDPTRSRRVKVEGNLIEVGNLSVGEYTYSCQSKSMIKRTGKFTIRAGVETLIKLDLKPAANQGIEFNLPEDIGIGSLDATITNRGGKKVWDRHLGDVSLYKMPWKTTARLPVGSYSIAAKLSSGESASEQFEISKLGEAPLISLQLK